MRLLILNHNARERGTYFRAFPFAQRLAERGHEVVFCCVQRERMYRVTQTRILIGGASGGSLTRYEMPNWSARQDPQEGRGPFDIAHRVWLAATRRFDVVWAFSHKLDTVIPARAARAIHGAAFVSDWCDRWGGPEGLFDYVVLPSPSFKRLPPGVQAARRRAFAQEAIWEEKVRREWADGVTVISRALRERTLALGVPEARVLHLPSGANLDGVRPLDKTECRRALKLPETATLIGYIANFHPDEELLLDALQRVMAADPAVRFVHTGAPLETPESQLKQRGLFERFHYLGWVSEKKLATALGACDMLAAPLSDRRLNVERWPHKLGDYLAAGRPIAACAVGETVALIRECGAGELGEATGEGLARAISRLIERRAEWDVIGRRARETAEARLDWDRLTTKALDFIRRVASNPRSGRRP